MPYAQGRIYFDSDSHLMETAEWLASHATPEEAHLIGELAPGTAGPAVGKALAKAAARRADPSATAKLLEQPIISGPKGWFAYGATAPEERSKALDLLGFQRQLVFPTFALGQFARSTDADVLYAGARALNRGMARFCAADPRLLAVGYLPLDVPERALTALKDAITEGVKAFWVSTDPVRGQSPAHIDHEPIWAFLAEANVPIMLHVGGGRMTTAAMHENGRPKPTDFVGGGENMRAKDYPAVSHGAQTFLTAVTLDGVFERHPGLRCGVIELSASWVVGFLQMLDHAAYAFRKNEPLLEELKLKPSEYIRRQVKFSLFPYEDAGWLIEQGGSELFMFASDFPHPEGGRDPVGRFEASLDKRGIGEEARERFYRKNFAELMAIE
jgi:predicted TIM-barrel fold metal-dependent hydrolase